MTNPTHYEQINFSFNFKTRQEAAKLFREAAARFDEGFDVGLINSNGMVLNRAVKPFEAGV